MSTFDKFLTCFPVSENYLNVLKLFVLGGGALEFSVLRFGQFLVRGFFFSHLKTASFQFWCLVQFAGILQFSLWFSVFVHNNMQPVLHIFLSNAA